MRWVREVITYAIKYIIGISIKCVVDLIVKLGTKMNQKTDDVSKSTQSLNATCIVGVGDLNGSEANSTCFKYGSSASSASSMMLNSTQVNDHFFCQHNWINYQLNYLAGIFYLLLYHRFE